MNDRPTLGEATSRTPLIRRRRAPSLIWVIPVIAVLVAGYLFWRTLSQQGPEVTITFLSADGLTAGQTKVRHKAVDLGTVERIELSSDMSHVIVRLRMQAEAARVLTDRANFWVVRARLTPGSISGLETIVSGSYIELDPGTPGGETKLQFTGLEAPPAVRSDEPGRTFVLNSPRLGSIATGSLVVYRDMAVGEVLGHDEVKPGEPIKVHVFVRQPYDAYVREGSYFWNDSGLQVSLGAEGFRVQVQSLQAVLAGAVAFNTPADARATPVAKTDREFALFGDEATAKASHFQLRIPLLVHFNGSVRGLASGAPVEMYGIPIGTVQSVRLAVDAAAGTVDVPVQLEIQPERFSSGPAPTEQELVTSLQRLVDKGLRAQLKSANLLTGQLLVAFDFFPGAPPAKVTIEDGKIVVPQQPGDIENITRSLSDVATRLDAMPLDQIAENINSTLKAVNTIANGPDLKGALQSLAGSMATVQDLVKRLDSGLSPALKRLPEIADQLLSASEKVNHLAGSVDSGYGDNSQFRRDLTRLLGQVNDAARSIRLLADFLDQHPEALVRGRTGSATER
jgi:paraquat-inducible protein B